MTIQHTHSVLYEDIIKNWTTCQDKEFWNELWSIHKEIPDRRFPVNFVERARQFTNTYIIESAIVHSVPNVSFFDDTHEAYHSGRGYNTPDFRIVKKDGTNTTAELKMVKSLASAYSITNWHNAEIHLVFDLSCNKLFRLRRDKAFIPVADFKLDRPLLEYDDCNVLKLIGPLKKEQLGL